MNVQEARWVILDVETTGLDPVADRIVEVAITRYYHGRFAVLFSCLVNPERAIPPEVSSVHGITDSMVVDQPTLDEMAPDILDQVRTADLLVAYNWPFDASFLEAGLGPRWTHAINGKPVVDPLVVARDAATRPGHRLEGLRSRRLTNVARALSVVATQDMAAHRAAVDCELCCAVLLQLVTSLPSDITAAANWCSEMRIDQDKRFDKTRSKR